MISTSFNIKRTIKLTIEINNIGYLAIVQYSDNINSES